jgi:predicted nucleic acid-binding protein
MSLIFWDTMLFAYWIERNPQYCDKVIAIRERMVERGDRLCTSAITIGELLAGVNLMEIRGAGARYRDLLRPPFVQIIDFDSDAAEHYGRIRVDRFITRPDAMQLACAAAAKVDLFITNDRKLKRKIIPGIQFIGGIDTDLL